MSDNNSNLFTVNTSPQWSKYTVTYSQLAAAATSNDIELLQLPAKTMLTGAVIKHSTAFSGGILTNYTVSVGISGTLAKYASAFNVFQAVSDTTKQVQFELAQDIESFANSTSIRVAAVSTGTTLDQATAGSVDIWVRTEKLS